VEVTGGCRKLHNEERQNSYSSPNIKSRMVRWVRWVRYVARVSEKRSALGRTAALQYVNMCFPIPCYFEPARASEGGGRFAVILCTERDEPLPLLRCFCYTFLCLANPD
jgi:hypothetical protein